MQTREIPIVPQGKDLCFSPTSTPQGETGQHTRPTLMPALPANAQWAFVFTHVIRSFSASLEEQERILDPMKYETFTETSPPPPRYLV